MKKRSLLFSLLFIVQGCTTYGNPSNQKLSKAEPSSDYSYHNSVARYNTGDAMISVAMSGGGARASAFAFGVLQGLKQAQQLKEVDHISSVSGGSFTAAYYGLYGDKIFTDFEQDFLYDDVNRSLLKRVLSPRRWFSDTGVTDEAIGYYQEKLFKGATFADMNQQNLPFITINATDLATGVRFSFVQEYFDLLCSDLAHYPVADAVAASAAVPVLFNPVVLKNHHGCGMQYLKTSASKNQLNTIDRSTIAGLKSYADKEKRQYLHLVDGGITDNLGLFALYDLNIIKGAEEGLSFEPSLKAMPHVVLISIDASTTPDNTMGQTTEKPTVAATVSLMTDTQLHRYNDLTKNLIKESLYEHSALSQKTARPYSAYFIDINLSDVENAQKKHFLNNIPTSLHIDEAQVKALIEEGKNQLLTNPEFKRYLHNSRKLTKVTRHYKNP